MLLHEGSPRIYTRNKLPSLFDRSWRICAHEFTKFMPWARTLSPAHKRMTYIFTYKETSTNEKIRHCQKFVANKRIERQSQKLKLINKILISIQDG